MKIFVIPPSSGPAPLSFQSLNAALLQAFENREEGEET